MAESSKSGSQPGGVKKVWTFILQGGGSMHLSLHGRLGPGHEHNGQLSVWKMVGTAEEAEAAKSLFTGPLVGATVQLFTETEDEGMAEIRRRGEP